MKRSWTIGAYIFLETILSYQALKWRRHLLPTFCLRLLLSTYCLRHMGTIFCLRHMGTIFCLRHLLPLFCLPYNVMCRQIHWLRLVFLSSPGPKPLSPKPKNPKLRGLGLTLKSHGPPTHPPITFKHEGGPTKKLKECDVAAPASNTRQSQVRPHLGQLRVWEKTER